MTVMTVSGTRGSEEDVGRLQAYAVYVANLFFLTSNALVTVLRDSDYRKDDYGQCMQALSTLYITYKYYTALHT
jgi:hypothetical protein